MKRFALCAQEDAIGRTAGQIEEQPLLLRALMLTVATSCVLFCAVSRASASQARQVVQPDLMALSPQTTIAIPGVSRIAGVALAHDHRILLWDKSAVWLTQGTNASFDRLCPSMNASSTAPAPRYKLQIVQHMHLTTEQRVKVSALPIEEWGFDSSLIVPYHFMDGMS